MVSVASNANHTAPPPTKTTASRYRPGVGSSAGRTHRERGRHEVRTADCDEWGDHERGERADDLRERALPPLGTECDEHLPLVLAAGEIPAQDLGDHDHTRESRDQGEDRKAGDDDPRRLVVRVAVAARRDRVDR